MSRRRAPGRRGLTLLELMLALAVTALVASALSSMLTSMSTGERLRRDNRDFIVRGHSAWTRISSYVGKCRSFLDTRDGDLVLWLDDRRGGETAHASELRWLVFDAAGGSIDVYYVTFPDTWTDVQRAAGDAEYDLATTDWWAELSYYVSNGWASRLTLVDGLASVTVTLDQPAAVDSRSVTYELRFLTDVPGQPHTETFSAPIVEHRPPVT